MFGAMRSGSNLLEKFLNQYSGLYCHGELFHPSFIGQQGCQEYLSITREMRDENPTALLDAIRLATPGKIGGYRIFQTHAPQIVNKALNDPYCAKIILTRDPTESYVSLKIAKATNQWLISDYKHRREARIQFDLEEYEIYLRDRDQFYNQISKALALNEQPFFEIDYNNLSDMAAINRLAAFIGDRNRKPALVHEIKRQNPGPIAGKIINYKEVADSPLLAGKLDPPSQKPKPVRENDTDVSRIYVSKSKALAFCPIPALPDRGVLEWMQRQGGGPPQNGYSSHRFFNWLQNHPSPLLFSVVRHPVERAYNAFMTKIFANTTDSYIVTRQSLEDQFGLMLPQGKITPNHPRAALEQMGYGVEAHRICFKLFLIFVAANLGNKTKIRQDGKWQSQSEVLRRYRVIYPERVVLKWENLANGLTGLEKKPGIKPVAGWKNPPDPAYSFDILYIYDEEIEALARAAYADDYRAFGYENLSRL